MLCVLFCFVFLMSNLKWNTAVAPIAFSHCTVKSTVCPSGIQWNRSREVLSLVMSQSTKYPVDILCIVLHNCRIDYLKTLKTRRGRLSDLGFSAKLTMKALCENTLFKVKALHL